MATDASAPPLRRRRALPRIAPRLGEALGGTLAVTKHWLRISARDRKFAITATLIPINYLFLFLITVINGNADPTALVVADHGPYAQAFVRALESTDSFHLKTLDASAAQKLYRGGRVVALITIPATFDQSVARGAQAPVSLQIDNVENDFTDDVRRGVDLAVNRFEANSAPRGALLIARETDEHRTAVPYDQYVMVSIVVVAIMIGGLFYGGVNVAREYELRSIIDMLLSPRPRTSLLLGMTLGTFLVAVPGTVLLLAFVTIGFGISAVSWPEVAFVCAVLLAVYAAAGVLLGTVTRQRNGLSALAILLSIPLLSLSGAFYPVSWSAGPIRVVAKLSPTYYGSALLQHAFYDVHTTPASVVFDYAILGAFLIAILASSALLMRYREQPA
jgi:ABC-2 type transport system permease protein